MWCIPEITDEYIKRMFNIIGLYKRPYDPKHPVICFDEKSKQLLGASKPSISAKPGKIKRVDYEYKRNGTANIFVAVEPKGKFRAVKATRRRTKSDFAKEIKRIINFKRYNEANIIHFVLDNLNTHFEKSFYETFSKIEAERILNKVKFHYTPKHASWLNAAEIEINVLSEQCLSRQMPTLQEMRKHIAIWSKLRNKMRAGINWKFTKKEATIKFKINAKHKN